MEVQDASQDNYFAAIMKQAENAANRARRRKGQTVLDHPPRERLISTFMMKLCQSLPPATPGEHTIACSQVPAPYIPCSLRLHELCPISVSSMKLETHYRGKRITVRVCTPPQRMTAIMAIVEDAEGTALLLQLYHQPDELVVPAEEILQPGNILILKEPYFKCCTDGAYSLRVDHVSDIVWLEGSEEYVPSEWREPTSKSKGSAIIRAEGNDAVSERKWAEALRLYTSAIGAAVTSDDKRLAYLNRSLANLRLGRPEKALLDAVYGSDAGMSSEKSLFREARALYELGSFGSRLEKLQQLLVSHPNNKDAEQELSRAKARLLEQQSGDYAFHRLYKQARQTPPFVDSATFSMLVEVRKSPGRGNGLFTTKEVSAGDLLLCEKAFAYSYAGDDGTSDQSQILMNLTTKRVTVGGQARLLTQVIQKLYHNPGLLASFCELYHGDYTTVPVSENDENPVVDSFFVEKVISLNCFGAPRTSRSSFSALSKKSSAGERQERSYTTCGIWLLASRINHSCVGNCRRSFIGDMQIVRATQNLKAGTEIFFPYRQPSFHESYEKTQKDLSNWGFSCTCKLCQSRQLTTTEALKRRKKLNTDLAKVLNSSPTTNISRAQLLLLKIEQTYPETSRDQIRLELWDPYFALGAHLLSIDRPREAIETTVKGLGAIGYTVTASFQQPDVEQWGFVNDFVPWAFENLFKAYKQIAPEHCKTAKVYAEMAYRMVVGESETILDAFPDLVIVPA